MNSPLVSIVLPVYNGADRLSRSIESVLKQTYQNWELIIVNDCSKDDSLKIAKEFSLKDKRINVISHEVNRKLPTALNTGFKISKGSYLTWTSHDNEFKEIAIEKLLTTLLDNPEIGFVYANEEIINDTTNEMVITHKKQIDSIVTNPIIGACFMYTRQVQKLVGWYDTSLFLAEDYDYWLRIWKVSKCMLIDNVLYSYYTTDTSLTSKFKPGIVNATLRVIDKNLIRDRNAISSDLRKLFLLKWFKYWYKFSPKNNKENNLIALKIIIELISRYPFYLIKFIFIKSFNSK